MSIEQYPTLYKRDENGSIREWRMERNGAAIRSVSGAQGTTNPNVSEWKPIVGKGVGKAAKTAEQQADFQIKSKYKKQLKLSYHENLADIDKPIKFDPMLAKKYEGWTGPCYAQPKLDGIRCIATAQGLRSRNGEPLVNAPHIMEALATFFAKNPDAILDGELYNHELKEDFNQIQSNVGKKKPSAETQAKARETVQYWVYDVPSEGDEKFSDRWEWLNDNLPEGHFGHKIEESFIVLVPTMHCETEAQLDELNALWLEQGYEGQMVREDAEYETKRSKYLKKRKTFVDAEFAFSQFFEGEGNWAGSAKAVEFIMPGDKRLENGRRPRAGISGTKDFTQKLLYTKPELVTVRFFRLTPGGIPRFGVAKAFWDSTNNVEGRQPCTQEELDELIANIGKSKD